MADDAQRAHPRKEAHLRAEERSASTVTGGSALVRGIVPGGALQPLFPDAFALRDRSGFSAMPTAWAVCPVIWTTAKAHSCSPAARPIDK